MPLYRSLDKREEPWHRPKCLGKQFSIARCGESVFGNDESPIGRALRATADFGEGAIQLLFRKTDLGVDKILHWHRGIVTEAENTCLSTAAFEIQVT